jgi:diguanylate cyclase (GGDEF)-like protein
MPARALVSRGGLLAGWALTSLGFLTVLATGAFGRSGTVAIDDYGSMVAPAMAAVACFLAGSRPGAPGARAWALLGASLLTWAFGGLIWTYYEVQLGRAVPFPSLADAGYLLSVPLAVAALLSFPGSRLVGMARLRPAVDGAIAAGALLFISWTTVLGPAYRAGSGSSWSQIISLAYPSCDVVTVTIALVTLARARQGQRTTMLLVSLGLILVAVADSAFAWFTAHGAYFTGNLFDTGYVAGFLLIGVAALQARPQAHGDPAPPTAVAAAPGPLGMTIPYLPLLVGLPLAVELQAHGKPLDGVQLWITGSVVVAVLLRQVLSLRVIVALSGQLRETVTALRDQEAQLHQTVATLRDREVELHHQAFHDPLTGLANRTLFSDRVSHALSRSRRLGPVIVLLADLDDFKVVNDTLGHHAGDLLLTTVADRLRAVVRPEDTVARLGGDEFAVLLDAAEGLDEARGVADRITSAMQQPFYLAGVHTVMGASIGIAAADATASAEALLRDADIAMYAAKAQGKGRCAVYAAEFAAENLGRLQLKSDLSLALDRGELSLKYQPIVDLDTGMMTGVEALLRWAHPSLGSVPRAAYIPIAETSGAMVPIGRWVLAQACAQAGRWQRARPRNSPPLGLSVNIAGRQLTDPLLIPTVEQALSDGGLAPGRLTLEITESILLDDEITLAPLLELKKLGVNLAIDDFGTGHSALSRLRHYPIDTLKVDQSFVNALTPEAPVPDVLITTILALGRGLGMTVIAEGVESENQLAALRALGCRAAQGFLFARPAEPDVISELIKAGIALTDPVPASVGRRPPPGAKADA